MKRLILFSASLLATVGLAQQYRIDWSTIDGGGGASSGGVYSVRGTIGQRDTGQMSGGAFRLQGGFWSGVVAVQTPGVPLLSLARTNGRVVLAWPNSASGWLLEQANQLNGSPDTWVLVTAPCVTNVTTINVIVPITPGHAFFRLRKP